LGIFVHWGVYAVPAFSPVGIQYAEVSFIIHLVVFTGLTWRSGIGSVNTSLRISRLQLGYTTRRRMVKMSSMMTLFKTVRHLKLNGQRHILTQLSVTTSKFKAENLVDLFHNSGATCQLLDRS
jgi:hypothetical protein